jgi:hypothetical protein
VNYVLYARYMTLVSNLMTHLCKSLDDDSVYLRLVLLAGVRHNSRLHNGNTYTVTKHAHK